MSDNNSKSPNRILLIICGVLLLIVVIFGFSFAGGLGNLFKSTVGQSAQRYFNQEDVRKTCTLKLSGLDATYEISQNQYSNAATIITDQIAVANLSTQAKKEINEAALNAIFGQENTTQEASVQNLFNTAAKYSVDFDKTDESMYRNVQESIRTERSKFSAILNNLADQKRSYRDYLIQESSKFRVGQQEYELVQALDSNDCLPGAYELQKNNPTYDITKVINTVLDQRYIVPRTFSTQKAFSTGVDEGFVQPQAQSSKSQ